MSFISNYIKKKNENGEKILSIFLTSGFPDKNSFAKLAIDILDVGADMLEIGFPFSDPLADGPIIQHSSQVALQNGINLESTFNYIREIRNKTDKPLILMGYANPVLSYGIDNFARNAKSTGVNGVIIHDVPIDEYYNFFFNGSFVNNSFDGLEKILLVTPTTSEKRIKKTDELSEGFVYYVSMTGTTGKQVAHSKEIIEPLRNALSLIKKNKMLIGFGISSPDYIKTFSPFCSGVIVGSAVIKSLIKDKVKYKITIEMVKQLKVALQN